MVCIGNMIIASDGRILSLLHVGHSKCRSIKMPALCKGSNVAYSTKSQVFAGMFHPRWKENRTLGTTKPVPTFVQHDRALRREHGFPQHQARRPLLPNPRLGGDWHSRPRKSGTRSMARSSFRVGGGRVCFFLSTAGWTSWPRRSYTRMRRKPRACGYR